jgi:hypothetical protein
MGLQQFRVEYAGLLQANGCIPHYAGGTFDEQLVLVRNCQVFGEFNPGYLSILDVCLDYWMEEVWMWG